MVEYVAGNAPPPSPLPPGTGAGTGNRTGDLLVPSLWPFVFQPAGLIRCWTGPLQDFLSTKNRSSDSRAGVCHHISTKLAFVIIFQQNWAPEEYKLLPVLGIPAGAFFSAKNTSLEFWEHAMSGYCHILSVFIDFGVPGGSHMKI